MHARTNPYGRIRVGVILVVVVVTMRKYSQLPLGVTPRFGLGWEFDNISFRS